MNRLSMKHLVKGRGEHVTGVSYVSLSSLQAPMPCDCCGKHIGAGTRVVGKSVTLDGIFGSSNRFSPTCLACAGLN